MFPPHTRGCTVTCFNRFAKGTVSPAHAGMYRQGENQETPRNSFPRTRGDVPVSHIPFHSTMEFPPHTRGCTL